jgi:hypothetical protein
MHIQTEPTNVTLFENVFADVIKLIEVLLD